MRKGVLVLLILTVAIGIFGCSNNQQLALPLLDENNVLVTHMKEPTLSVIDLQRNQVIHQETFEFIVHAIAQTDSDRLAVANKFGSNIVVLDLHSKKKRDLNVEVYSVSDLLYDDERRLLFATEAEKNRVAVIDMEQGKIKQTIQVGHYPQKMTLVDQLLYVLNGESATVDVIDMNRFEVVQSFSVLEHPTDLVVVGDAVWVGGHGPYGQLNEHVYIYERSSGQLIDKVRAGLMPVAFYYDDESRCLYALSHGSNEMHWIDVETYTVEGMMITSDNPYYVTGDDRYIYVTTLDGNEMIVFDRQRRDIVEKYSLQSGPFGIVLGGKRR